MNASTQQYVFSVDLGGTNFKAGVVSSSGGIICRVAVPTPKGKDYQGILSTILGLFEDLARVCPPELNPRQWGISIGVPGVVSIDTGDVTDCFNVLGHNPATVHLGRDLRKLTGREVRLDRDVNLAALGEHWIGAGRSHANLICIFIGTGIGAGLILNDRIVRGPLGAAGEFGHLTIDREGPRCGCGNRGCVEQYASGPAIARDFAEAEKIRMAGKGSAGKAPLDTHTARKVFELARGGDQLAVRVINEAFVSLGIAIADVVTLLNPELVILGGGVGKQFDVIVDTISAEVRARCRPAVSEAVSLVPSALWDDAALIGGARLFFDS